MYNILNCVLIDVRYCFLTSFYNNAQECFYFFDSKKNTEGLDARLPGRGRTGIHDGVARAGTGVAMIPRISAWEKATRTLVPYTNNCLHACAGAGTWPPNTHGAGYTRPRRPAALAGQERNMRGVSPFCCVCPACTSSP
jgi:hypothetical protein